MKRAGLGLAGAAAIAAGAAGSSASASTEGAYLNTANYSYRVYGMPDFDQVRAAGPGSFGLPNSGNMYCVPTATLNIICYIANHGFPEVMDIGAQNWQSQSVYNSVGINLFGLGNFMGTDASDGTGGSGWRDGAKAYLDARSGKFTVNSYYANNNYAPTQAGLTHTAVCGSLVTLAYGRYSEVGTFAGLPLLDRNGGHAVTLARSTRGFGDSRRLWVRDPADEQTDLFTQSLFGNRSYGLLHERAVVTSPSIGAIKVMTEIGVDAGSIGSSNRYIDGYLAIRPKFGYSLTNDSTVVTLNLPITFTGFPDPPFSHFKPGGLVHDIVINPDMNAFLAVVADDDGDNSLIMINAATDESVDMNDSLGLMDPEAMIFGRNRRLYLLDGRMIKCFDIDLQNPIEEASVHPPDPVHALTYDDMRDVVVGISASANSLVQYSDMLGGGSVHPLPAGVDLGPDSSIAFNPGEGTLLIHPGNESTTLYQATPLARGEGPGYSFSSIALPGVDNPKFVEADDSGMFYIVGEGGVQAFARDDLGRFSPTDDSEFNGIMSDRLFRVSHSRRNDGEYPEDAYFNIPPEELESGGFLVDCPFDLNGDGQVGAADLARLLGGWGEPGALGDQDGDGVDAFDLAGLLGSWGPCP